MSTDARDEPAAGATTTCVAFGAAIACSWWFLVVSADGRFLWWWPLVAVAASFALAVAGAPCRSDERPFDRAGAVRTGSAAAIALPLATVAGWLTTLPGCELAASIAWIGLLGWLFAAGGWRRSAPTEPIDAATIDWRRLLTGTAVAVAAATGAAWIGGAGERWSAPLALWAIAVAAAMWGAGRSATGRSGSDLGDVPVSRSETILVLLVAAAAGALRHVGLETVPVNIDADEGRIGGHIIDTFAGLREPIVDVGWNGFAQLAFAVQGMWVDLLGPSLASLRVGSATAGTIGVVMLYLFLRTVCGPRAALIGAALLAVNPEHLAWSRVGLMNGQAMTLVTLAMALLAVALKTGRLMAWAGLGVALGGCMLTYHAAKAVVGVVVLVCALELAAIGRRRLAGLLAGGLTAIAVALITVAPVLPAVATRWDWYSEQIGNRFDVHEVVEAAESGDTERVRRHLARHVGSVVAVPVTSWQGGFVPAGGFLDRTTAVFVVGAPLWLLLGWRHRGARLVLGWIVVYAVGSGMLTADPPWKPRLVMALPAVVAAVAMVLDLGARRLAMGRPRTAQLAAAALALLCVTGGAAESWKRHVAPFRPGFVTSDPGSNLIRILGDLEADGWLGTRPVILLGSTIHHEANLYHAARHGLLGEPDLLVDAGDDAAVLPFRDEPAESRLVIVAARQRAMLSVIEDRYPEARRRDVIGQRGETVFTLVEIDREDIERQRGLRQVGADGTEMTVARPPFRLDGDAGGRWIGSIFFPDPGHRTIGLSGCDDPRISIGGEAQQPDGSSVSTESAAGWHRIELAAGAPDGGCDLDLLWAASPDTPMRPVPTWALRPSTTEHGLTLRVWEGSNAHTDYESRPTLWRIDPVLSYDFWMIERQKSLPPVFHEGRWTARWDGFLRVPDGTDRTVTLEFDTASALLAVGGEKVSAEEPGRLAVAGLPPGEHALTVRVGVDRGPPLDRLLVKLRWSEDGAPSEPIPHTALAPRPGSTRGPVGES